MLFGDVLPENPRIEDLRRRVDSDPASIAFAQLAEEYRRSGRIDEAVSVCRAGLEIHPGYLSARITLGRALMELGQLEAASTELSRVLEHASENLAAIRGLGDIHHRQGRLPQALAFYQTALLLASRDPDLEDIVAELRMMVGREPVPPEPETLSPPAELIELERLLEAIHSYRQRLAV